MAGYPEPIPGLVIRYSYLWKREADLGQIEGQKHRPCVVVVCVQQVDEELVVTVAPITHTPPADPDQAIALTPATRRRLELDEQKNWIMATEVNAFFWPGPDLAPTPDGRLAYGELPAVVFEKLIRKILAAGSQLPQVTRNE
ncbi:MAG: type II toxin-antitoxin system PemK/MazF family toxin [Burkholderiaceae bacterium]|nr:type II toxin-antitoxin system PemK/MazF family toxin [Burkholderiaceae bacterium]